MIEHENNSVKAGRTAMHPLLIVLALLAAAVILTHLIPAGKFERQHQQVVPSSYHMLPKIDGLPALIASTAPKDTDAPAHAAGLVALFEVVPAGMTLASSLIFMVMFVGGAFGVLRATGALDAGIDRLVNLTAGNLYVLGGGLLLILSCGSTFLGFSSEYVAIVPMVLQLGRRLQLPNLFAPAVVALADFVGYSASVSNPIVLGVAQPLAGVPLFSGILPRFLIFLAMLAVSLAYLMLYLRKQPRVTHVPNDLRLSIRQLCVLFTLVLGGAALIAGAALWSWHTSDMASVFIAIGIALAAVGGLSPTAAADAYLDGMKVMILPCLLIGLAGGIGIMLQTSQVTDSIVQGVTSLIPTNSRGAVAIGLMAAEMLFGVLMPSASAKAAISIPIMGPIAHLFGVNGQIVVTALLLGSGMTNMITPTNTLLLAFLATSKTSYLDWVRFILPLFTILCAIGFGAIYLMAT